MKINSKDGEYPDLGLLSWDLIYLPYSSEDENDVDASQPPTGHRDYQTDNDLILNQKILWNNCIRFDHYNGCKQVSRFVIPHKSVLNVVQMRLFLSQVGNAFQSTTKHAVADRTLTLTLS